MYLLLTTLGMMGRQNVLHVHLDGMQTRKALGSVLSVMQVRINMLDFICVKSLVCS